MRSREFITEIGDQPYKTPARWRYVGTDMDEMRVTLPDGRYLTLVVEHEQQWAVFTFLVDDEQYITGGGDAYRIFSTAAAAASDWVRKRKPMYFAFTASIEGRPDNRPPSRPKLYDRMAQRLLTLPVFSGWTDITNRPDLWPEGFARYMDDRNPGIDLKTYVLASPRAFSRKQ
jgi:hypothetical protein